MASVRSNGVPGLKKDLKRLRKRFPSLEDDLKVFIKTSIRAVHVLGVSPESQGHYPVAGLGIDGDGCFIAKKFACRSLKGSASRSGIRLVYWFDKDTVHLLMIELFFKGDKELPDIERIRKALTRRDTWEG